MTNGDERSHGDVTIIMMEEKKKKRRSRKREIESMTIIHSIHFSLVFFFFFNKKFRFSNPLFFLLILRVRNRVLWIEREREKEEIRVR